MDGSGINGKIGAAGHCTTNASTEYWHLGTDQQYNVHAGELTGFHLGLQILNQITQTGTDTFEKCNIYSDSQAAIKTLINSQKSGQAIIKDFLDEVDHLLHQHNIKIGIFWIPGHEEIHGNEKADKAANEAALNSNINAKTCGFCKSSQELT